MATKKDTLELTTAINRLVVSSERLERTTHLLLFVTIFLFVFTFVAAAGGYNYPGGAHNFLLALVFALIVVVAILVLYKLFAK